MRKLKKSAASLVLILVTASMLLPVIASANDDNRNWELFNYNYRFSSGPDYRQVLGSPTQTSIAPTNPANDNVRRNAGAAYNPPPAGFFSGAFATEQNNIFATQSPAHRAAATTDVSGGMLTSTSTIPGGNVTVSHTPPLPSTSNILPDSPRLTAPSYFSDGSMGRLTIPAINLHNARVFHGVGYNIIDNHIGHFPNTSAWDGNIGLAAHNGGRAGYFQNINRLNIGDEVIFETPQGTRTYRVNGRHTIHETDLTLLDWTADNRIVLITCIAGGRRDMRFAIVAVEV